MKSKKFIIPIIILVIIASYIYINSEKAVKIISEEEVLADVVDFEQLESTLMTGEKHYVYLKHDNVSSRINSLTLYSELAHNDSLRVRRQTIKRPIKGTEERLVPIIDDSGFVVIEN